MFNEADIISSYTQRQTVEDGVLVPPSGPLYGDGDDWIPAMVAEAGFRLPVLITSGAFDAYVAPLGESEQLASCQARAGSGTCSS
jgi:hypothetical protein